VIVAVLNQESGAGKTTLATHLAGEFAVGGQNVLVIDADPQGAALDWAQTRRTAGLPRLFGVFGVPRETLCQEVRAIARSFDHVIIDGPSHIAALTRSALLVADRVLIPVQPNPCNDVASSEIVTLIREAQIFKPDLQVALVFNRRGASPVVGCDIRGAFGLPSFSALKAQVSRHAVLTESASTGQLAREVNEKSHAADEIAALAVEVLRRAL